MQIDCPGRIGRSQARPRDFSLAASGAAPYTSGRILAYGIRIWDALPWIASGYALLAEGEALVKAHERLHLAPTDQPEQRAYRTRLKLHRERLRAYIRALREEADDT